ncbi:MAG: hypothetical protein JWL87_57 [Candidatus Adlerbacteria bacterium]|nr:hypothetical protein [Candidatus Adlerbacteria bacterium]
MQFYGVLSAMILLAAVALLFGADRVGTPVATVASPYVYLFGGNGALEEARNTSRTASPYWWLNSGGRIEIAGSLGSTMQGDAPQGDRWRTAYAASNPTDTDQGLHPQNIFRLVTRSLWGDASQEVELRLVADQKSQSPNRNASNGLFLMSRYVDGDTLYYAGLRVDGMAVIKKKYNGAYYTLAEAPAFPGAYDRDKNPNLLPHGEWLSIRSETAHTDGGIAIRLYLKRESDTNWLKLLEAIDRGQSGTPAIRGRGRGGIRTDFMDVQFRSYRMENL